MGRGELRPSDQEAIGEAGVDISRLIKLTDQETPAPAGVFFGPRGLSTGSGDAGWADERAHRMARDRNSGVIQTAMWVRDKILVRHNRYSMPN